MTASFGDIVNTEFQFKALKTLSLKASIAGGTAPHTTVMTFFIECMYVQK